LILIASVITVGIGMVAMRHLEGLSWVDGLYFSVVSLTTVGYGDITPQTAAGKVFVVFYLLVGIAIVAALLNTVLRNAMARRTIHRNQKKQD